ncbi:MAG: 5'-nucleotidase, lipoprotein e(P4) family [Bacteroidales bacterium]|nr:5'-nucleotidase, lipoprotein e(P4) family [Bacteroidales bacterium]
MKRINVIIIIFLVLQALLFAYWFHRIQKQIFETRPDTVYIRTVPPYDTLMPAQLMTQLKLSDQAVMATLFQQSAAEYRALCYQAFAAARVMLDNDLNDKSVDSPRAIIVDIDETILDNSPHSAKCIINGTSYPAFWDEWCDTAIAKAVPGALEFLNLARGYGVSVFYITNRKAHLQEVTMKNLRQLKFPQVEEKHMMFRTGESSKENRRNEVKKTYHITMLIGDNLGDFSDVFGDKLVAERTKITDSLSQMFGRRYIVLPNAMYGDWEGALYGYDYSISDSAKHAIRYESLQAY